MNRRKALALLGGGIILAAGTGTAGFLLTRTPTKALAPWQSAGSLYEEPRRRALSYALLAPNPHNQQPWLVDLSQEDEVTLLVDRDRLLPHTDPYSRQVVIGLGCFLELLRMAAAEDGYRVEMALFPDGEDPKRLDARPIARCRFVEDPTVQSDPLFRQALARRSLKEAYDTDRPVPDSALTALEEVVQPGVAVGSTNRNDRVENLRLLTRAAMEIELRTPSAYKESVDVMRIGKAEIEANPDGIDLSGAMFESLAMLGLLSREALLDPNSDAYRQGYDSVMAPFDTSMGFVWLVTEENRREDQIRAGRDWLRVNLAATALGLGTQPLSQALQEYPEMAELYQQVHASLAPQGGTVQMLARLGYGPEVAPSPRWPLEAKIAKL